MKATRGDGPAGRSRAQRESIRRPGSRCARRAPGRHIRRRSAGRRGNLTASFSPRNQAAQRVTARHPDRVASDMRTRARRHPPVPRPRWAAGRKPVGLARAHPPTGVTESPVGRPSIRRASEHGEPVGEHARSLSRVNRPPAGCRAMPRWRSAAAARSSTNPLSCQAIRCRRPHRRATRQRRVARMDGEALPRPRARRTPWPGASDDRRYRADVEQRQRPSDRSGNRATAVPRPHRAPAPAVVEYRPRPANRGPCRTVVEAGHHRAGRRRRS